MATKNKQSQTDIEISPVLVPDDKWKYRWNDQPITYEQYKKLVEDHKQWVREQESKSASSEDSKPVSKKRNKKSSR